MGLANTTTNLSYARNELIKVGESFIFDKVADMIWYIMTNDDISTTSTAGITVGEDADGHDVKFFGDTSGCYFEWDADADQVNVAGRINFLADASRTGEGSALFANGISIGMATPGDCQGMKMEFDYGVSATVSGDGRQVHGLDIKMTMDQDWDFGTKLYNGTVRGARIQAVTSEDVSGRLTGAYINAIGEGTKTIRGYVTGASPTGAAMIGLEARTELAASATITTPVAAGIVIFHHNKGSATLTGKYRALSIEVPLLLAGASISSTTTAIHIGNDWAGADTFDYGLYVTNSTCGIGAYIGTCTTGIQLAGTQTTGIVIGSSVVTGISVDSATNSTSTTDGSIHTDGGLGVAKTLYVGEKIRLTGAQTDYILIGTDESTLLTGSAPASPEVWDAVGVFVEVTGTSTRTGSTSNENHAGNFLMQEAGQTYFHFGLQGRAYVASGGTAIEMYGVHGRARILNGGTVGSGSAGGFIGVLGEANNQSGGTVTMGAGTSIYAGVRGLFKNGGTLTAAGKSCAIMAGVEEGTSDCVLYLLSGGGTTSTNVIEINNAGTTTQLMKIQTAAGFASVNASFTGAGEPDASLEVLLGGATYYLYLYDTEVT